MRNRAPHSGARPLQRGGQGREGEGAGAPSRWGGSGGLPREILHYETQIVRSPAFWANFRVNIEYKIWLYYGGELTFFVWFKLISC